jgi:trypsin
VIGRPAKRGIAVLGIAAVASLFCVLPTAARAAPGYKVVGGSVTPISAVPWQVAIVNKGATSDGQYCGGSLIRPSVVLTAAHCVFSGPFSLGDDYIVAGATQWADPAQGVRIPIASALVDSAFGGAIPSNDAAVLVLASAVPPANGTTIKLAGPDEKKLWKPGVGATVSGWGFTSEAGPPSPDLRSATVPILKDDYCRSVYFAIFDPSSMLCAGYRNGGIDGCFGDSGGPLKVPARGGEGGLVRLAGVVSFGDGCARANEPGVYSRVGQKPLQAFVQKAVNATPDPGDVVGSGGVCAGIKGKKGRKCRCKTKSKKKQRKKCLRKVSAKGRG